MFLRNRDLLTSVLSIVALAGCGGDDKKKEGDADSSAAALCERICARAAKAKCENEPPDCAARCGESISATPVDCKSELDAFTQCAAQATFTCDEDDESEAKSCERQLTAWDRCLGSDDEPADGDDDDATGVMDAGRPRPDASVDDEPVAPSSPDAASLCESSPTDSSCNTCLKTECCDTLAGCDGECLELLNCVSACSRGDCAQTCLASADPGEVQQFLLVATCLGNMCDVACSSSANPSAPPEITLPDDCIAAGSVPEGSCDLPASPNAYDCKMQPFPDCVPSPTGTSDIWCCAQ